MGRKNDMKELTASLAKYKSARKSSMAIIKKQRKRSKKQQTEQRVAKIKPTAEEALGLHEQSDQARRALRLDIARVYYRRDCMLASTLEKFLDTQQRMCAHLIRGLDSMLSELPPLSQIESFRTLYDWDQ